MVDPSDTVNSHIDRCTERPHGVAARSRTRLRPNKPSVGARAPVRVLGTADGELNPHGRSPVLTCGFMPLVGVQCRRPDTALDYTRRRTGGPARALVHRRMSGPEGRSRGRHRKRRRGRSRTAGTGPAQLLGDLPRRPARPSRRGARATSMATSQCVTSPTRSVRRSPAGSTDSTCAAGRPRTAPTPRVNGAGCAATTATCAHLCCAGAPLSLTFGDR